MQARPRACEFRAGQHKEREEKEIKLFRKLIKSIGKAVEFNHKSANYGKAECSSYAIGKLEGYIEVLRNVGHKIRKRYSFDGGCWRIWSIEVHKTGYKLSYRQY